MKRLSFLYYSVSICVLLLLCSCHRDDLIEYTSDINGQFSTSIVVEYFLESNKTRVYVSFFGSEWNRLKIPNSSFLKVNGVSLVDYEAIYYTELDGKPNCTVEFKDTDGIIYTNTIVPPDTAYFINFPDSLPNINNFDVAVNAPLLDSGESTGVCTSCDLYEFDLQAQTTDSVLKIYLGGLQGVKERNYLNLVRIKQIENPNLPAGGGSIRYSYFVNQGLWW